VIIYLAPGEPSYLPDSLFGLVRDEACTDLAPVIRYCADCRIPWEIVAFFAATAGWCTLQDIARSMGKPVEDVLRQLEALVQTGLIQERLLISGPQYRWRGGNRLREFFGPLQLAEAVPDACPVSQSIAS